MPAGLAIIMKATYKTITISKTDFIRIKPMIDGRCFWRLSGEGVEVRSSETIINKLFNIE